MSAPTTALPSSRPSSPPAVPDAPDEGSGGAEQRETSAEAEGSTTAGDVAEQAEDIEVDFSSDSGFAEDDLGSDTTSLASTLLRGHIENGRKYNGLRDDYWGPSDDQQFETMDNGHLFYLLMESERENPLFRSRLTNPREILDIGTGTGTWAIDVADKFPDTNVYGVDLYPPPNAWVPPNCFLQVEDVLQEWSWRHQFDLVHMRLLLGAFTPAEWDTLYATIYENLRPGGWIEQVELDVRIFSDDGTLAKDSLLAGWGENFLGCGIRNGRPLNTQETMRDRIAAAGFTNVQDDLFKCPLGSWPKGDRLKQAGKVNWAHWNSGFEGWAMWLLTKHGIPTPWSADEVRVYVAKVRQEFKQKRLHVYHLTRRVWAQKPL